MLLQAGDGQDTAVALTGVAVRQDGRSASLTAPNGPAQQRLFIAVIEDAGIQPPEVGWCETHGTGTKLGDPVESGSLREAVISTEDEGTNALLAIGGLKASTGHTEGASGIPGLLKALLASRCSVPNALLRILNPHVGAALKGSGHCLLPVNVGHVHASRHHGLTNAFGFSGTIASTVLSAVCEEALATPSLVQTEHASSRAVLAYMRRSFHWRDRTHPFAEQLLLAPIQVVSFRLHSPSCLDLLRHHVVQSRVLFPGAAYLEMARATAVACDAALALCGTFFLQPLVIEAHDVRVECTLVDSRFEVRSGANDAPADAIVHCSGTLATCEDWQRVNHALVRSVMYGCAAGVSALYDRFDTIGLQYGPGYRTLMQAWGGGGAAVARLRMRLTREGTQVHPADLDDAMCTSALAGSQGDGTTRLSFAVDEAQLQYAPSALWAVRCPVE